MSGKRNKRAQQDIPEKPTKQDYAVAKYLRDKCPKKQTVMINQKVHYFQGSKAVDVLLESKWAKEGKKEPALFTTRADCVDFLERLRVLDLISRAEKIVVKKVEPKKDKKKGKDNDKEKEKDSRKEKDKKKNETEETENEPILRKRKGAKETKESAKDTAEEPSEAEGEKGDGKKEKEEKKKRKIRLEPHPDQRFIDSADAVYVWFYEPTSIMNIILGTGIVLGAIGVCLFPLWPPFVRQGVYYLSLAGVGLIGLLIGVSLLRYVVFAFVFGMTFGKIHFWYLPNLTEDCGFFESFVPLYTISRGGEKKDEKDKKKSKKRKEIDEKEKEEEKDGKSSDEKSGKEDAEEENDQDFEKIGGPEGDAGEASE